mgnify:CR=1 FL=1|tara:strand:- start:29534 stop:29833 length:300 start_codon:yes stop_codon:yes gene_type:complete
MDLKEIVENAPEGTTHFYYSDVQPLSYLMVEGNHCKYWNSLDVWSIPISNAEDIFIHSKPRLIDDVKRIVELESQIEFKIKECQELAQACNRYKNLALK